MNKSLHKAMPWHLKTKLDTLYASGTEAIQLIDAMLMFMDHARGVRPLQHLADSVFKYQEAFTANREQAVAAITHPTNGITKS